MKIVHVHHHYWPVVGGLENAVKAVAEEQAKRGHEVHVITSIYGAIGRPKHEEVNGVWVHRIKATRLIYPDLTIPREVPRDLLRRADIVHGWSQNSLFTYKVCKEAKRLGKPIVTYFLGVDYLKNHYNPLIRLMGYPYQKLITKKVVKITDLALVTNEYEKKLLRERYGVDAAVLPHGVDEIYLKLPNIAHRFREKYGVEGRIVAYIGRMHPTKGLDLLVKVFGEVTKQAQDAVLVIAGKGDEKYLRKCLNLAEKLEIKNKVKYIGYIPEEDKIALIDASKAIVLPTRHAGESYPLLVDEVLARNKPLIITNASKVLKSRVSTCSSCIVSTFNAKGLAKHIVEILEKPQPLYSRIHVLTWRAIANYLLEIYERLTLGLRRQNGDKL